MKKALLYTLLLFVVKFSQAQNWCAPGAEWHYRVLQPFYVNYQDGYLRVKVTSTIWTGVYMSYQLSGVFYGELYPQGSGTTTLSYFNVNLHEQNQVVYINGGDTLVNLNASVGDKWRVIRYGQNSSGLPCERPYLIVVDTGRTLLNGVSLKTIKVAHSNYPNTPFDIIDKIGTLWGFLYPYYTCELHGWILGNFVCYSDNNFALYQNPGYNLPCDFTTVGKDEYTLDGLELTVFPNPATDNVKIDFSGEKSPQQVQLIVNDLLGREVLSQDCLSGSEVNLSDLKEGLYTLRFVSEAKVWATRKLVIAE